MGQVGRSFLAVAVAATPSRRVATRSRSSSPGGDRIERFPVLLAGRSLKGLTMASFETRRAVDWLLEPSTTKR